MNIKIPFTRKEFFIRHNSWWSFHGTNGYSHKGYYFGIRTYYGTGISWEKTLQK